MRVVAVDICLIRAYTLEHYRKSALFRNHFTSPPSFSACIRANFRQMCLRAIPATSVDAAHKCLPAVPSIPSVLYNKYLAKIEDCTL